MESRPPIPAYAVRRDPDKIPVEINPTDFSVCLSVCVSFFLSFPVSLASIARANAALASNDAVQSYSQIVSSV
jgi:hypothetical protein